MRLGVRRIAVLVGGLYVQKQPHSGSGKLEMLGQRLNQTYVLFAVSETAALLKASRLSSRNTTVRPTYGKTVNSKSRLAEYLIIPAKTRPHKQRSRFGITPAKVRLCTRLLKVSKLSYFL